MKPRIGRNRMREGRTRPVLRGGAALIASALAVGGLTVAGPTAATGKQAAAQAKSSNPADWLAWHLDSNDEYRLEKAPPAEDSKKTKRELKEIRQLQDDITNKIEKRIKKWNKQPATIPWTEAILDQIDNTGLRPPVVARGLAMLHTGLYDAMIAAADSKRFYKDETRPSPAKMDDRIELLIGKKKGSTYAPVQAAMAGAAEDILTYLFPDQEQKFHKLADQAVESRLYAGANYRSDVKRARDLGHDVAAEVLERAADNADGFGNTAGAHPRPTAGDERAIPSAGNPEKQWQETPTLFENGIGNPVGTWKTWLLESAGANRGVIVPPSTYGSEEFMTQLHEVVDVQANLTNKQREIAFFWDDGPATFTPSGHWFDIGLDTVETFGEDLKTKHVARIFALLGATEADASIAFFEAKYYWWSIRPISAIWRVCFDETGTEFLCTDEEAQAMYDANPGADVPCTSCAPYWGMESPGGPLVEGAATSDFNPDRWLSIIQTPPFPSYPGGHSTFSGSAGKLLTYFFPDAGETLNEQAQDAADSRLFGGIHFDEDNDAGLVLGRSIADVAIGYAENDGSGL